MILKVCGIWSTWQYNNNVSKDLISSDCQSDDQLMAVRLFRGVFFSNPEKNRSVIGRGSLIQN